MSQKRTATQRSIGLNLLGGLAAVALLAGGVGGLAGASR